MFYSDKIKHYFHQDRFHGALQGEQVLCLRAENEKLQYQIELYVQLGQSSIDAVSFKAFGDPNMIACLTWLCEQLQGQTLATIKSIPAMQVGNTIELHITKMYAATVIQSLTQQLAEKIHE